MHTVDPLYGNFNIPEKYKLKFFREATSKVKREKKYYSFIFSISFTKDQDIHFAESRETNLVFPINPPTLGKIIDKLNNLPLEIDKKEELE